jgi:hypothetical protein
VQVNEREALAQVMVDPVNDVTPWQALAVDGVTPSTELAIALDNTHPRPGADPRSGLITASGAATNHTLRRTFAPTIDLTTFDELRLALYSNRVADGKSSTPFCLEIKLGSTVMPPSDPGNTWRRFIPATQSEVWDTARFDLSDLPAAVRGSVSAILLRCTDAGAFQLNIEDIIGVREEMLGDIDIALQLLLNNKITLNGNAVPAVLHPGNGPLTSARPYIEILNYDVVFSRERTASTRPRGDFFNGSYSLQPTSNAFDVFYQISAVADDRKTQSQMLELILRAVPPRGEILVNDYPLQVDAVTVNPIDMLGGFRTDAIPLFFKVQTRQRVGSAISVQGARNLVVDGDLRT